MAAGTIAVTVLAGLAVTLLFVRAGFRAEPDVAGLGTMSHQWLAAHNASQHASSY